MVNKAVEDLVCSRFGEKKWLEVKAAAGVDVDVFVSDESYPDELTYNLVGGACRVLGAEASAVLELFGEHWVLNTAQEGYGELLDSGGSTLPEFLENLPNFHARVSLIMPKLRPPEFEVSDRTAASLHLHYRSHRHGLQPFVIGLVKGLGRKFKTEVAVELLPRRGRDHDVFLVRWG
jgi:hypothetical protein